MLPLKSKMTKTILLASILLFFYACDSDGGCTTPTNTVFEHLIEKPIPSYVTDVEGAGHCWQGYAMFLKFKASDKLLKNLDENGYIETNWNDVGSYMKIPDGFKKKIKTGWHPSKIKHKKCYKNDVENDWSDLGTHYFVYDLDKQIVYFYGIGA